MQEIQTINNATFLFSHFKDVETASLGIFLRIGSRFEKKDVRGIAHFLEHMVFKGSGKFSHRQIKREIEGRGGSMNAFTSHEITAYYAHFLKKNLASAMDILVDMVLNPLLREEDINKERKVILEEIKMYNDLPASRASMHLDKLLWPNNSLGEEIVGHFDTVSKIGRRELLDFKNSYYIPRAMVVSCSGNFLKEQVTKMLSQHIKKIELLPDLKTTTPDNLKGIHIKTERKKLEQAQLCVGFRGVSYNDKERLTVELINVILGANMSSRLFEALREKRALCYDISTDARKYKDNGAFVIQLGLDKTNINTALATILKELTKLKSKNVLAKELSRAKDYFLGQIAMSMERPQGRMFHDAESYITQGKIYSLSAIEKDINDIGPQKIKELSQRIFSFENICVSCLGDISLGMEKTLEKTIKLNI